MSRVDPPGLDACLDGESVAADETRSSSFHQAI